VVEGSGATASLGYIEPDHLGTPRAIIDPSAGKAVWTWAIQGEAFGATPPNEDPDQDGDAFHFDSRLPGQRFDSASGLSYNYRRDYDSGSARYIESDPVGLDGGMSTYGYVGASPLMWKDSSGLVRWSGTVLPSSGGFVINAGLFAFDLKSQCVRGRKAHVLVRAWGVGFGVGADILPAASVSSGGITLEDHLPDITPGNFNGLFGTGGGGLNFFNQGGGCSGYQIGDQWTPALTKGPFSCGMGGRGLDLGANIMVGRSTLVGLKWEKCDECEPVDTPFRP
jgi:RHS repeat-associated protein